MKLNLTRVNNKYARDDINTRGFIQLDKNKGM